MSGHDFFLGRRVALRPLPAATAAEIARRWPQLDLGRLAAAFEWYVGLRDSKATQPAAHEIAGKLDAFHALVAETLTTAQELAGNNLGSIIDQTTAIRGQPDALHNLVLSLTVLNVCLPNVPRPSGRPRNERHVLASQVVVVVADGGLDPDATPNGPLVQLVGKLLRAAGENPRNVVEIVKPVLRKNGPAKTA